MWIATQPHRRWLPSASSSGATRILRIPSTISTSSSSFWSPPSLLPVTPLPLSLCLPLSLSLSLSLPLPLCLCLPLSLSLSLCLPLSLFLLSFISASFSPSLISSPSPLPSPSKCPWSDRHRTSPGDSRLHTNGLPRVHNHLAATRGGGASLSALRALRVMRPLRAVTKFPELKQLVVVILKSMPKLASVIGLLSFIFFVFGILGVQLFAGLCLCVCVHRILRICDRNSTRGMNDVLVRGPRGVTPPCSRAAAARVAAMLLLGSVLAVGSRSIIDESPQFVNWGCGRGGSTHGVLASTSAALASTSAAQQTLD